MVVYGLLEEGIIREGQKIKYGPNKDGEYSLAIVDSIHKCKMPIVKASPGDAISLGLSLLDLSKTPDIKKVQMVPNIVFLFYVILL